MLAEFSINPTDATHISTDVAKIVEVLEQSGLTYRLGPMSTSIEGDWEQVMDAIHRCHQVVADGGHGRLITNIVIDDRKEGPHSLEEAVRRVEEHLGHVVPH